MGVCTVRERAPPTGVRGVESAVLTRRMRADVVGELCGKEAVCRSRLPIAAPRRHASWQLVIPGGSLEAPWRAGPCSYWLAPGREGRGRGDLLQNHMQQIIKCCGASQTLHQHAYEDFQTTGTW